MRFVSTIVFLLLHSAFTCWGQSNPTDTTKANLKSKYLLTAYLSSGEVVVPTGRIIRTIALSHPRSMEIANINLNYTQTIRLKTDPTGETIAVVSFSDMKLTGDVDYKGFDISNHIFPSLVSFRLLVPGSDKEVLATVKAATVNRNGSSVSIALHKNTTELPIIDQLAFYHSDDDFIRADNQMKLIDRYYTAGWLLQRTDKLFDRLQKNQLHYPSEYLATSLEVIIINDWLTRQHFNLDPMFRNKDTLDLIKTIEINRFKKRLIDQDFFKSNVISNDDLLKAATIFAENFAYYFDSSKPDFNRDTYLSQMAESRLSSIGFTAIREFTDSYRAYYKQPKLNGGFFEKANSIIRYAMTSKAAQLAEEEHYAEAMNMLNASDKFNLQNGTERSQADNILVGKLTQRLYGAYLDFALKSLKAGIYTITDDFYQKALQLKQSYNGLILPDTRERYLADMICKAMLSSADKSLKNNDIPAALVSYEKIIHIAEKANLKEDYETARIKMEEISNRPSGYKPWEGETLAIVKPVEEIGSMQPDGKTDNSGPESTDNDAIHKKHSKKEKAQSSVRMKRGKLSVKKLTPPADTLQPIIIVKGVAVKQSVFKQQLVDQIQGVHLKIWSGDTISSRTQLNRTDSLLQLLSQSGDKSLEADVRALKTSFDDKRCELQNASYLKDLELIRNQIASKDFSYAAKQLQLLIAKSFPKPCMVDRSEAVKLLASLDNPLKYSQLIVQLDSVAMTQDPSSIIKAYENVQEYYRQNMIDKWGVESPDLMKILMTRNETPFLLKAVSLMLETHRPAYALELLKKVKLLEPKPDQTLSLQKRMGELLAAADHTGTKTATEMLTSYNLDEKWYKELITSYKKQWKLFSK